METYKRTDSVTQQNEESLCLGFINLLSNFKSLVIVVNTLKHPSPGAVAHIA